MAATNESIYRELKLLRSEIKDLKSLFIPEVEPEKDELIAIAEGEKEFKAGNYSDWRAMKARLDVSLRSEAAANLSSCWIFTSWRV